MSVFTDLEVTAFGLMMSCPYTMDNSDKNCPLYKVREEHPDVESKLNYVRSLSDDQLLELVNNHYKCSEVKRTR